MHLEAPTELSEFPKIQDYQDYEYYCVMSSRFIFACDKTRTQGSSDEPLPAEMENQIT